MVGKKGRKIKEVKIKVKGGKKGMKQGYQS